MHHTYLSVLWAEAIFIALGFGLDLLDILFPFLSPFMNVVWYLCSVCHHSADSVGLDIH
jgi:hypothetical protein